MIHAYLLAKMGCTCSRQPSDTTADSLRVPAFPKKQPPHAVRSLRAPHSINSPINVDCNPFYLGARDGGDCLAPEEQVLQTGLAQRSSRPATTCRTVLPRPALGTASVSPHARYDAKGSSFDPTNTNGIASDEYMRLPLTSHLDGHGTAIRPAVKSMVFHTQRRARQRLQQEIRPKLSPSAVGAADANETGVPSYPPPSNEAALHGCGSATDTNSSYAGSVPSLHSSCLASQAHQLAADTDCERMEPAGLTSGELQKSHDSFGTIRTLPKRPPRLRLPHVFGD